MEVAERTDGVQNGAVHSPCTSTTAVARIERVTPPACSRTQDGGHFDVDRYNASQARSEPWTCNRQIFLPLASCLFSLSLSRDYRNSQLLRLAVADLGQTHRVLAHGTVRKSGKSPPSRDTGTFGSIRLPQESRGSGATQAVGKETGGRAGGRHGRCMVLSVGLQKITCGGFTNRSFWDIPWMLVLGNGPMIFRDHTKDPGTHRDKAMRE